ncbi:MAG: hypothetical protein ACPG49_00700 [Chitinophagales bacterium]
MKISIKNSCKNLKINTIVKSLFILLVFCFAANESFAQYRLPMKHKISKKYQVKQTPKYNFNKPACPDLKAMPIQFTVLSRPTAYTAKVKITAIVKNIGGADYISGRNQQGMQLYVGSTLVKNMPFTNLAKGQTKTITYYMTFSIANEFPPMIKFYISYDPDIAMDGNTKNDECTYSNNQSSRDSREIGGLL